jgi:hypothetical protein
LILRNGLGSVFGPFGELYPIDANPYDHPVWAFHVDHEQEIPRVNAGAPVTVDDIARGKDTTVNAQGAIVQARRLTQPVTLSSIFAERGNVLVHPAMHHFVDAWEYVPSPSFATVDPGNPERIERTLGPIVNASPIRAKFGHRARERAADARHDDSVPMTMRLAWTVGNGSGPLAVARLWPVDAEYPITIVPVVNVLRGFDPIDPLPVRVWAHDPRAPFIGAGEAELWPFDFGRIVDLRS